MTRTIEKIKSRLEFGEWLRERRRERGLSIHEQAKLVGLSPQQLQNYEHGGVVTPRLDGITKIAAAYELEISQIISIFCR